MKKYVVAASITAGLSMIAAPALAQTTGTIGAGYNTIDAGGGDVDSYGINGSVTVPAGGSFVVQLDGAFSDSSDIDVQTKSGTAHLLSRSDSQAWGGYVGLTDFEGISATSIGGEYAKFFGGSTLAFNAGYGNIDIADTDLFNLNGEYRIFATDNLRFDLGLGAMRVDSFGSDSDVYTAGVGVEYRFTNSPISIGGAYSRLDTDGGDADVLGVSLKWDFGNASLKGRDRTGSTFSAPSSISTLLSLF